MKNLEQYKMFLKTQEPYELSGEAAYVVSFILHMKGDLDYAIKSGDLAREKHLLRVIQRLRDQLQLIDEEEMTKDPASAKEFQDLKAEMRKEGKLNTFIYPD